MQYFVVVFLFKSLKYFPLFIFESLWNKPGTDLHTHVIDSVKVSCLYVCWSTLVPQAHLERHFVLHLSKTVLFMPYRCPQFSGITESAVWFQEWIRLRFLK